MIATELVRKVREQGADLRLRGEMVELVRPKLVDASLKDALRAHRDAVRSLLALERADSPLIVAAALLREEAWLKVEPPCAFFIGHASEPQCRRCGGGWREHFITAGGPDA